VYRKAELETYVADAASKRPAPGGGSVSGLVGALAAAMSEMAANFTAGRKKYADVQETVSRMLTELSECRLQLLKLMERDVEAYGHVGDAYGMPKDSDEQAHARTAAIDKALRGAMDVPLEVMCLCARVAGVAADLVDIGNRNLITDVAVSAVLAEAACVAARFNVEVNLKYIKDGALSADVNAEMDELAQVVRQARADVSRKVNDFLRG
jgi:formiminotetrahydrofolate cyclodeaminase